MSDLKNPHAFPLHPSINPGVGNSTGMTLRDWFAGQALTGMGTWMPIYSNPQLAHPETLAQRALWAYQQADAMLAQRTKDAGDDR